MKRPKFSIVEQLGALTKKESGHLPFLYNVLRTTNGIRDFRGALRATRMRIHQELLEKRLPYRNSDGSINWDNYFAAQMQLGQPVKRSDIFPNGTIEMSEEEILADAHQFMLPLSAKFNFAALTTTFDPVEFPEVIDEDHREMTSKLNATAFMRTVMGGCSGHGDRPNGYLRSLICLTMDPLNPASDKFIEKITKICGSFTKDNIRPSFEYGEGDDLSHLKILLNIDQPEDWEGESYQHSDACKAIRDQFWDEVGDAAEGLKQLF